MHQAWGPNTPWGGCFDGNEAALTTSGHLWRPQRHRVVQRAASAAPLVSHAGRWLPTFACMAGERLRRIIKALDPELLQSVGPFDPSYANPCWWVRPGPRPAGIQPCAGAPIHTCNSHVCFLQPAALLA
jgi:hypothetical protein